MLSKLINPSKSIIEFFKPIPNEPSIIFNDGKLENFNTLLLLPKFKDPFTNFRFVNSGNLVILSKLLMEMCFASSSES